MKRLVLVAVLTAMASVFAAPVAASRPTSLYYFWDCIGDGPTEFYAVKTALPDPAFAPVSSGGAFDLTDGSGTYQILSFGVGSFDPPGIRDSSGYNLVCTTSLGGVEHVVYGNFAAG